MTYEGHQGSIGGDRRSAVQADGEDRRNLTKCGTIRAKQLNECLSIDLCTVLVNHQLVQRGSSTWLLQYSKCGSMEAHRRGVYWSTDHTVGLLFDSQKVLFGEEKIIPSMDWRKQTTDRRSINGSLVGSSIEVAFMGRTFLISILFSIEQYFL